MPRQGPVPGISVLARNQSYAPNSGRQAGRPPPLQLTGGLPQPVYRVTHASTPTATAKGSHALCQPSCPPSDTSSRQCGQTEEDTKHGNFSPSPGWIGSKRLHLPFIHLLSHSLTVLLQTPTILTFNHPSVLARVPSAPKD